MAVVFKLQLLYKSKKNNEHSDQERVYTQDYNWNNNALWKNFNNAVILLPPPRPAMYLLKKSNTSPNPPISLHWKSEKHFTIV